MQKISANSQWAIVYLAYGAESLKFQVILSVLTLFNYLGFDNKDISVIIYTDDRHDLLMKYLGNMPVMLEDLSSEKLSSFIGPNKFPFRAKPVAIKECFSKYQKNILFVDTDTFFRRNPTSLLTNIAPGRTIMNEMEYDFVDGGQFETQHWFDMRRLLKLHKYTVEGQKVEIPISTIMWNSGVIGISYQDSAIVNEIVNLTDEMYSKSPCFLVEQFVTSYILQRYTQVNSSEDYIGHYWLKAIKNSFNQKIPSFLEQNKAETKEGLCVAAYRFAEETNQTTSIHHESTVSRMRKRLKLIMKVARKGHL